MHTGGRRGEKEAEGVKKAKKCTGEEEERKRVKGGQENDGRGRQGAGRLRDEMFSGPCCLFLEQTAALKATAARCHCYEHTASENGTADLKPVSHSEIQG